jgi:argininosuccinate lyase
LKKFQARNGFTGTGCELLVQVLVVGLWQRPMSARRAGWTGRLYRRLIGRARRSKWPSLSRSVTDSRTKAGSATVAYMTMTGRILATPSRVWHEEVLAPQFDHEVRFLLPHYILIEKVLLLESLRMGLVDADNAAAVSRRLSELDGGELLADPRANMSDISFAVERFVTEGPMTPFAAWHLDRSRNDMQACAQLMAMRTRLFEIAEDLVEFGRSAVALAWSGVELPMPGYTHAQPAQIITPGFYFAALAAETLTTLHRLLRIYDDIDASPLGAGSMAGQELAWDRDLIAARLGFARPVPHALVAVASRSWALGIAAEAAAFAVTLSRFTTDLIAWSGGAYGFFDLPDDLAGISAAMPQKRNFPVLERIRGRCSMVAGGAFEVMSGQRNTSYTNTVEVSKEAGSRLWTQISALHSCLRLATSVTQGLTFRGDRMREACEQDFLGGFRLSNMLTAECGIPWRTAQVIAGQYIREALKVGASPTRPNAGLLEDAAAKQGIAVLNAASLLTAAFDVDDGLRAKQTAGSTHPDQVRKLLASQEADIDGVELEWRSRSRTVAAAAEGIDDLLVRESIHAA